jgi:hypothetical protein
MTQGSTFSERCSGAIVRYVSRHHIALLALFVALGGSAAAATFINGKSIKPRSIPANRLAPAATASLSASDIAVYCRFVRSRPRSYSDVPCRSRSEPVGDALNVGGIALGTDGNPVITHGGHPINLVRCNDLICAGGDESIEEINGTFCGGGAEGKRPSPSIPTGIRSSVSETAAASLTAS